MISDLQVATADDGKRLVVYPLELTLRDLFAMAAMQAIIGKHEPEIPDAAYFDHGIEGEIAVCAYIYADAMLAERAK